MRKLVWFFDLDNTLHDASHEIFAAINVGMTQYLMRRLAVDETEANRLRVSYWQRYGATLVGVVRHHGVCADEFLRESHGFDVPALVRAEAGLPSLLRRLPGRKILLTNAPRVYSEQVLARLGISRHFKAHYSVDTMRVHGHYRVKPSRPLLRALMAKEGVCPRNAVLVEDTLLNLKSARAVGMRTVHVRHPGTPFAPVLLRGRPAYVDLQLQSVRHLLRKLHLFG